jgi:hypothetical protein
MSPYSEAAGSDVSRGDDHESRSRARGHAHPGRRSGAQGLCHPPRPSARHHARHAGSDRYRYGRDELLAKINVALGGRAAEKVAFSDRTTRAESVIQNRTQIARNMVGRWGQPPPSSANCWRL